MEIIPHIVNPKGKIVFQLIRKYGTISKTQLLRESGLTNSTLTRMLDELCLQRCINEMGLGDSTGGRKPILYQVNPDYAYILGLDISRMHVKLVICDMQLQVKASHTWDMDKQFTPDMLQDQLQQKITKWKKELHINDQQLLGLGIGAVGPLDRHSGYILDPLYFDSPDWHQLNICSMFQQHYDFPVFLDNGANNALLAEYWLHRKQQVDHLLYLHVGVGIRSSMMTDGQIVHGAVDMEGAVGQMIIQSDGLASRDPSGNYGAWESYVGLFALEQKARSSFRQGRISDYFKHIRTEEDITFSSMVQQLNMGDPLMRELFDQSATYFGIGLANMLNILHPQQVILGGPLITAVPSYFLMATETAKQKTYHFPHYQVIFGKGKSGEDAIAIGSAALVIQQVM